MESIQQLLTYLDLQHLIAAKTFLVIFLTAAFVGIYKNFSYEYFLLLIGITCSASYLSLTGGLELMLWGISGDEVTIGAMYEMFAHGDLFSDFAYKSLPPFYPPLWFQIFGLFGRFLDYNGIETARLATTITILLFPIGFFGIQKWFWSHKNKDFNNSVYFLSTLFALTIIGWNAVITKPYELVSAALAVLWTQFLLYELWKNGLNNKKALIFGITGGIIFLLFYFWFFLIALAIALFNLFYKKVSLQKYIQLSKTAVFILTVGALYWLPLSVSYFQQGSENWQLGFWNLDWLTTANPAVVEWSIAGLTSLMGLFVLIIYRKRLYIRSLLSLFAASYLWYFMGLVTLIFFASPIQSIKGFAFFNKIILSLAGGYGLSKLYNYYKTEIKPYNKGILIIGTILLSTQLIFGSFLDQDEVLKTRVRAKTLKNSKEEVLNYLKNNYQNIENKKILHSGLVKLHSFLPLNEFLYFNQHNSHPAANFSKRYSYLRNLSLIENPSVFYRKVSNTPFGSIDIFVLFNKKDKYYTIPFHLDNFPHKIKETTIKFPKKLFKSKFFKEQFKNEEYVILKRKSK